MFPKRVNEYDVLQRINSLKTNCVSGFDGITTNVIKFSHTLLHIINLIYKYGEVPIRLENVYHTIFHSREKANTNISKYIPISMINNYDFF